MTKQVLEGIRVVDFCLMVAGAVTSRHLADHGATVIHIESRTKFDSCRVAMPYKEGRSGVNQSGHFNNWNCNKLGITLNLNHPRGVEVAKRIIALSDVVVENFAPGTMEKWGLGYTDLTNIKPDIIMLRLSAQGQNGPYANHRSTGTALTALAGFTWLTGWRDRGPVQPYSPYTDTIVPRFGAFAVMAALDYRRRTGKGQCLDLPHLDCSIHFLAPLVLDYTVNGRIAGRNGNRHPYAAPHNAYPCKGEDRWCAIAVFTDKEWESLCETLGHLEWGKNRKFATATARKQNEDELDRLVAGWTSNLYAEEVMTKLQSVGVPAGVVQNGEDIHRDPQLEHRNHFWVFDHTEVGPYRADSFPCKLSKTPATPRFPAPCLGEHNEYVYTKILGMSDQEFVELLADGVFE